MAFKRPFDLPDFLYIFDPLKEAEHRTYRFSHPLIDKESKGFEIVQLTDLHMGDWIDEEHVRTIVRRLNSKPADLYAMTGDYIGYDEGDILPCIKQLDKLDGPAFAVLGNHDHWTSGDLVRRAFSRSSIRALHNEAATFELNANQSIQIVGVDDHATNHADPKTAFADIDKNQFCLTLNHVPAIAPECAQRGAHLVLSGHTHGYQVDLPGLQTLVERFGVDFYAGPYRLGKTYLYICRGLGSTSWPFRIGTKPEITRFKLNPGSEPNLTLLESETISIED